MKSTTDNHWNERAASIANDVEVNIMDVFQRELEYDYICKVLQKDMTILEVGCGNGFSTARFRDLVKHVDAFDFAENMIERAKKIYGEKNNRFIHDNVLHLERIHDEYDAVLCVRVLINLRNLEEQKTALVNLIKRVKINGFLILVEGFENGFAQLSHLRKNVGLPNVEPAKINFYSSVSDLMPLFENRFETVHHFHLGMYDFLTRVVYPLVVGSDNAKHNSVFSEKCHLLSKHCNFEDLKQFSRIQGFILKKLTS